MHLTKYLQGFKSLANQRTRILRAAQAKQFSTIVKSKETDLGLVNKQTRSYMAGMGQAEKPYEPLTYP